MSIMDKIEDALEGVEVTASPRSGKRVTYKITQAGFEAKGLRDLTPQAQLVWQVLVNGCKKAGTDEFTLEEANAVCEFLYKAGKLETTQPPKRIFAYYRSVGARDGGNGFLARRWLTIK